MTLNILFMTKKRDDLVCLDYGHYFEQAVGKVANCKWAGRGWPDHLSEPLNATVRRVMPDVDWVIYYDFEIRRELIPVKIPKPHKRSFKVATITSDIHKEPYKYTNTLNNEPWDAFLMLYTMLGSQVNHRGHGWIKTDPERYLKALNSPIMRLTPSIDPTVFNMFNSERDIDALFLGTVAKSYYPLRNAIYKKLPLEGKAQGWNTVVKRAPKGMSFSRKKKDYLERGHIVGERYADYLSRAKCFLFGTSIFKYPLLKFFEGMASGACIFSDAPLLGEELHLIPDENYVEINLKNWKAKLEYYMDNEEERKKMAMNGYKTTMKYHTNATRALELIDFLEAHR